MSQRNTRSQKLSDEKSTLLLERNTLRNNDQEKILTLRKKIETLTNALEIKEQEMDDLSNDLLQEIEKLKKDNASKDEYIKQLKKRAQDYEDDVLESEQSFVAEVNKYKGNIEKLKQDHKIFFDEVSQREEDLNRQLSDTEIKYIEKLDIQNGTIKQLNKEIMELKEKNGQLQEIQVNEESAKKIENETVFILNKEIMSFKIRNDELRVKIKTQEEYVQKLENDVRELNEINRNMIITIRALEEANNNLVNSIESLRSKIRCLEVKYKSNDCPEVGDCHEVSEVNRTNGKQLEQLEERHGKSTNNNTEFIKKKTIDQKKNVVTSTSSPTDTPAIQSSMCSNEVSRKTSATSDGVKSISSTNQHNAKPNVLILGDDIGHGWRKTLQRNFGNEYTVQAIIKPKACFENVIDDVENLTRNFSFKDYLIITAGSNDFEVKKYPSFRKINIKLKNCTNTNIILTSVPYCKNIKINERIFKFNCKLNEYAKKLNYYAEGNISFLDINNITEAKKQYSSPKVAMEKMHYEDQQELTYVAS